MISRAPKFKLSRPVPTVGPQFGPIPQMQDQPGLGPMLMPLLSKGLGQNRTATKGTVNPTGNSGNDFLQLLMALRALGGGM